MTPPTFLSGEILRILKRTLHFLSYIFWPSFPWRNLRNFKGKYFTFFCYIFWLPLILEESSKDFTFFDSPSLSFGEILRISKENTSHFFLYIFELSFSWRNLTDFEGNFYIFSLHFFTPPLFSGEILGISKKNTLHFFLTLFDPSTHLSWGNLMDSKEILWFQRKSHYIFCLHFWITLSWRNLRDFKGKYFTFFCYIVWPPFLGKILRNSKENTSQRVVDHTFSQKVGHVAQIFTDVER